MSDSNGASASANGSGPQRTEKPLRLGGMALRNGLLIHGPRAWAAAARTRTGTIEVASGPKPVFTRGRLGDTPIFRGPLRLAEALAVVPLARTRLRSARLPLEDRVVVGAAIVSLLASAVLRRSRPREDSAHASTLRESAVALVGALPALAGLRNHDLAAYHGVEHKSIAAYEVGADPAEMPKEHRRCGSNLILPLLILSVAGQVIVDRLVEAPGPAVRGAATLAGVGLAVELFGYADREPESTLGRAVHGPGHEIQRLISTREPSAEQLAVGAAALEAALRAEAELADSL